MNILTRKPSPKSSRPTVGAFRVGNIVRPWMEKNQNAGWPAWTPERIQAVADREAAHKAWTQTPAGRAWLARKGLA